MRVFVLCYGAGVTVAVPVDGRVLAPQLSVLVFNWFAWGSLYMTLVIIANAAFPTSPGIVLTFEVMYLFLNLMQVVLGLGNRAQDVEDIYYRSSIAFGAQRCGSRMILFNFAVI